MFTLWGYVKYDWHKNELNAVRIRLSDDTLLSYREF